MAYLIWLYKERAITWFHESGDLPPFLLLVSTADNMEWTREAWAVDEDPLGNVPHNPSTDPDRIEKRL